MMMMMMTMRMMTSLVLHVSKGALTPPGGVVRHAGYSAPLGLHALTRSRAACLDSLHARTQLSSTVCTLTRSFARQYERVTVYMRIFARSVLQHASTRGSRLT